MTVESTARKQSYTLDQVTEEFDFTFRALTSAPEDIKCAAVTGSTTTLLTYLTDYTVDISSDGVGGTVTLVDKTAVSKGTLTIYRETTNKQESDYDDYNQFPANTLEEDLDRRTMIAQETAEDQDRTLKLPITSTTTDLEVPEPSANKILGWNDAADALENKNLADLGVIDVDIDAALTANSDSKVASQKAIKSYVDNNASGKVSGTFTNTTITTGTLVITYSTIASPYLKSLVVADSNGTIVLPDNVTFAASSTTLSMISYIPITGTWSYIHLG